MKKKIAVITAAGIGDGLIFHIASNHLVKMGCHVTTFNDHLSGFGPWLPNFSLKKQPTPDQIPTLVQQYDAIILQHDNSSKAKEIVAQCPFLYTFYGSFNQKKHGLLKERDFVCNPHQTMVGNIEQALFEWFGSGSKDNGLSPPLGLIHRKHRVRVAIHSSSSSLEKNWPWANFHQVSQKLSQWGYEPVFLTDPQGLPLFSSLEALTSFIYESGFFLGNDSGPGHIASSLEIPSLIIAQEAKQMELWRPGWGAAQIITPPRWASFWKWSRKRWTLLVSPKKVTKELKRNVLIK